MSRRDTIIIAVLINAGLLIVLLTTALKKDEEVDAFVKAETTLTEQPAQVAIKHEPNTQIDEVDQVLSQYTKETPAIEASTGSNFIQDLQAITTAQPQAESITPPEEAIVLAPAASNAIEVKVKKGDFLEKIAKANGSTVEEIMKLNNLSSTQLKIGQVLKIQPKLAGTKTVAKAAPVAPAAAKYYTVKNGDNPWTIAVKNHMKVEELLKLNNLNEEKARRLKPGDKLRIK